MLCSMASLCAFQLNHSCTFTVKRKIFIIILFRPRGKPLFRPVLNSHIYNIDYKFNMRLGEIKTNANKTLSTLMQMYFVVNLFVKNLICLSERTHWRLSKREMIWFRRLTNSGVTKKLLLNVPLWPRWDFLSCLCDGDDQLKLNWHPLKI